MDIFPLGFHGFEKYFNDSDSHSDFLVNEKNHDDKILDDGFGHLR